MELVLGSLGSGFLPGLLSKKPSMPQPAKPAVMPTPDDDTIATARRRQAAELQARSGRQSTILSGDDKLGG